MLTTQELEKTKPTVIQTRNLEELSLIRLSQVQAVIYHPDKLPDWFSDLSVAVKDCSFRVPRTIIEDASRRTIEKRLHADLPSVGIAPGVRKALIEDMLSLVDLCGDLASAETFRARYLTNSPNPDCGYHVDTAPADAPAQGLLRVYCGTGTEYPHPSRITSLIDFYIYVYRREQLTRRMARALKKGGLEEHRRTFAERSKLDEAPPFLRKPQQIERVPAGCIVAMKYANSRFLWSEHLSCARAGGWIHRSPMKGGEPRFLVNINACR